jgi:protein-tyrosine-phosphatase
VIRSLGRRGLHVHIGWCSSDSPALRSKYIAKVHDIPPYSPSDDSWKTAFISILAAERFDLVIPCSDQTLLPLQAHRSDLERYTRLAIPDGKAFAVAFDKFETYDLAKSLGIRVAKGCRIRDRSQAATILSEFRFPVVLKPHASYSLQRLTTKDYVRKAYAPDEMNAYLDSFLPRGELLVQENFIGTGVGVEVLAHEGELLVAFHHVRIHEPLMGGGSTYRKSAPLQPELLDATRQLLRALNYTGVAMFEYIVNFATGDWIFVEINGRFWGSLPLALAAGADFPYYLYQLLIEGRREFPQEYKTGIYCRNLVKDLGWMVENLRARRSDPTLATRPLWRVALEIGNIIALRERSDTFVWDDPKPGFVELLQVAGKAALEIRERIVLAALSFSSIRRLHAKRTRQAIAEAKTVLFVCKGNICRSPFAQEYAQTVLPRSVKVLSSGYYPEEGRASPPQAVAAAREFRIDLSAHRSAVITEEIVRRADAIVTFDENNRKVLCERYPFARKKIHRLGVLASRGPVNLRDPFGESDMQYRTTFKNIKECIDACVNPQDDE